MNEYIRKAHDGILLIINEADAELEKSKLRDEDNKQKHDLLNEELMLLHQLRRMIFEISKLEVPP